MQLNMGRKTPEFEQGADLSKTITLGDVGIFSGEELILRFGASTVQQLVDLIVAAIRKGDDDEVAAIDGRLREVETLLQR